jgi:hypothetical protein
LPAEEEVRRKELLLKLFFSANATKEEVVKQLVLHQKKIEKIGQQFKHIEEDVLSQVSDDDPRKLFWTMTLRYGILHVKADARWLAECFKMLKRNLL